MRRRSPRSACGNRRRTDRRLGAEHATERDAAAERGIEPAPAICTVATFRLIDSAMQVFSRAPSEERLGMAVDAGKRHPGAMRNAAEARKIL
jgi:hypothetical protein